MIYLICPRLLLLSSSCETVVATQRHQSAVHPSGRPDFFIPKRCKFYVVADRETREKKKESNRELIKVGKSNVNVIGYESTAVEYYHAPRMPCTTPYGSRTDTSLYPTHPL